MFETRINEYGRDKLKKFATYEGLDFYPTLHMWQDLHSTEPKKFILYFAVPDDKGDTFVIPYKWCDEIRAAEDCTFTLELNPNAIEKLKEAGKFSNDFLYPIIYIWQDLNKKDPEKRKFEVFYAILNDEKKPFIVQSTWGKVICLDEDGNQIYIPSKSTTTKK